MSTELRFEISELVAQYVLHPDFRDFFVEGPRDKNFYDRFLKQVTIQNEPNCIKIQDVNIPFAVLQKHGLSGKSEKNRVIALALELATKLSDGSKCVTCIADADFDYLLETLKDCDLLLYTDYTCLEMYTFTSEVLGEFLAIIINGFPFSAESIMSGIIPILVDLFLVRATNFDLNFEMEWLPIKGRRYEISKRRGTIDFNVDSFVRDYLTKNNMYSEQKRFWKRFKELKEHVSGDCRKFINRDDYVELLGHYLYKVKQKGLKMWKENPENLSKVLLGYLEVNNLCKEQLFAAVISRVN